MVKIKSFLLIAIMTVAGMSLSSCNEEPTSLGYSLIKDTIGLYTISETNPAMKMAGSSYSKTNNFINSGHLLLGKAGVNKSAIFMGFQFIPDSLGFVTENDIVDATITMYPQRYALGDTNGSNLLSFNIYDVNKKWEVKLQPEDAFSDAGFKGLQIGTFSGSIKLKDTLDSLKIGISKSLPVSWFKKRGNKDTTIKDTVWGLAYYPNENSTVINQFSGNMTNYIRKTKLTVIYKNKNKNYGLDTIVMYTGMDKNLPLFEKVDTKTITVRGGSSQHGRIDLVLDSIPIFAGIHLAELELTLDKSRSSNGNYLLDSSMRIDYYRNVADDISDISPIGYDIATLRAGTTDKYFTSGFAGIVTDIVKLGGKGSLVLRVSTFQDELGKAQTMVFYGFDDPVVERRPKLKIIYSILKEKNNK